MEPLHQGDILKIEKIKHPVLVASQDLGVSQSLCKPPN